MLYIFAASFFLHALVPLGTIHQIYLRHYSLHSFQTLTFIMNRCYNSLGQPYRCRSTWNNWGRWVALGVIVAGALLLFFLCR